MTETKTEAETIWEEIKDRPIDLFAIPNKKVSDFCRAQFIVPHQLYVVPKTASSFLAALEKSIGPTYTLSQVLNFIVISRTSVINSL